MVEEILPMFLDKLYFEPCITSNMIHEMSQNAVSLKSQI